MDLRKLLALIVLYSLTPFVLTNQDKRPLTQGLGVQCREESVHNTSDGSTSVEVAKWNWDHVGLYLTITVFIVLSGLAKVGNTREKSWLF
jgi:hypothetical protein